MVRPAGARPFSSMLNKFETDWAEAKAQAMVGGGQKRIEAQHARGKLTARERLELLLDAGTFREMDQLKLHRCTDFGMEKKQFYGDGVVTGYGLIGGRLTFVAAQDFTVLGGSVSKAHAEKICKVMDRAKDVGAPIINLCDGAGARLQEGIDSLAGYADIFHRNVQLSGVVPQLCAIMGPCAGGSVYSPALMNFVMMVNGTSNAFITGPDVVRTVLNEEITQEELGGAMVHAKTSGVASLVADNDIEALRMMRELFSFLPLSNEAPLPYRLTSDHPNRREESLNMMIPSDANHPYDVKDVIGKIVDDKNFFEIHKDYAPNIVVGFARMNGKTVGVVANQPMHLAGCLNIAASVKGARFVRFCDSFNIPLLALVDVPGFLPGRNEEHNGIILHGAKLLYAFSEATVPKVTITLRKSFGGAHDVMQSMQLGADVCLSYPTGGIAVMGAKGAVEIIFRNLAPEQQAEEVKKYEDTFLNPMRAANRGFIDDVIEPATTRERVCRELEILETKDVPVPNRKHGNIPL